MLSWSFNSPTLFPGYQCSPSICADVQATARSRLEEGDLDSLVRSRFLPDESGHTKPLSTGSRLLHLA